jgi:hypothetical protein
MPNRRRERFIAYFNGPLRGSRSKLMERTGLTPGRVSQLFDEKQAFGERAARNLAESLGLPGDYFEVDRGAVAQTAPLTAPITAPLPPALVAAFERIGAELEHVDEATREALAPLLQRLARSPHEAPRLGVLAQRLLAPADTPVTSATEAEPEQRGYEGWDGINRRTRDEPVKTERRRPPLGLYDPESKPKRPKPGPKVIGGNW